VLQGVEGAAVRNIAEILEITAPWVMVMALIYDGDFPIAERFLVGMN
jgi:hypothetical protein